MVCCKYWSHRVEIPCCLITSPSRSWMFRTFIVVLLNVVEGCLGTYLCLNGLDWTSADVWVLVHGVCLFEDGVGCDCSVGYTKGHGAVWPRCDF